MSNEPEPVPHTRDEAINTIAEASERIGVAADAITEAVVVLASEDELEEDELD